MKCFQTESKYLYNVAVNKSSIRKYIYDHINSFIVIYTIFKYFCFTLHSNNVYSYQAFTKHIYRLVNINQLNVRKGLTWSPVQYFFKHI